MVSKKEPKLGVAVETYPGNYYCNSCGVAFRAGDTVVTMHNDAGPVCLCPNCGIAAGRVRLEVVE